MVPLGRSLRAVLNKKKIWSLKDCPALVPRPMPCAESVGLLSLGSQTLRPPRGVPAHAKRRSAPHSVIPAAVKLGGCPAPQRTCEIHPPHALVQATVNEQNWTEPARSVAWTRALLTRCTVDGACGGIWGYLLKTKRSMPAPFPGQAGLEKKSGGRTRPILAQKHEPFGTLDFGPKKVVFGSESFGPAVAGWASKMAVGRSRRVEIRGNICLKRHHAQSASLTRNMSLLHLKAQVSDSTQPAGRPIERCTAKVHGAKNDGANAACCWGIGVAWALIDDGRHPPGSLWHAQQFDTYRPAGAATRIIPSGQPGAVSAVTHRSCLPADWVSDESRAFGPRPNYS